MEYRADTSVLQPCSLYPFSKSHGIRGKEASNGKKASACTEPASSQPRCLRICTLPGLSPLTHASQRKIVGFSPLNFWDIQRAQSKEPFLLPHLLFISCSLSFFSFLSVAGPTRFFSNFISFRASKENFTTPNMQLVKLILPLATLAVLVSSTPVPSSNVRVHLFA